eukprot:44706-Rhodomonas_salina.1
MATGDDSVADEEGHHSFLVRVLLQEIPCNPRGPRVACCDLHRRRHTLFITACTLGTSQRAHCVHSSVHTVCTAGYTVCILAAYAAAQYRSKWAERNQLRDTKRAVQTVRGMRVYVFDFAVFGPGTS